MAVTAREEARLAAAQGQARAFKDRAAQLQQKGKLAAAIADLRKAVELVPGDLPARKRLAELYAKADKKGEAIREYEQLAGKYAADGLLIQAIAVCKVILQLDAQRKETLELLASFYARKDAAEPKRRSLPASMAAVVAAPALPAIPDALPAHTGPVMGFEPEVTIELSPVDESDEVVVGLPLDDAPDADVEIDISQFEPVPLFSDLPQEAFMAVLESVTLRTVDPGTELIREGAPGDSMFILVAGAVDVVRTFDGGARKTVAQMKEGTFFGEMGLVSDAPRLASVVAARECQLLELSRQTVSSLGERFPEMGAVVERFYRERLVENLLRSNAIFRAFDAAERQRLVARFSSRTVAPGTVLLKQGEPGDGLYLLLRGRCEAFHDANGQHKPYPDLHEGAVFGEVSILLGTAATATVRAATQCVLLVLDREAVDELVLSHPEVRKAITRLSSERLRRTADMLAADDGPPAQEYLV